jgi:hypothetical protein
MHAERPQIALAAFAKCLKMLAYPQNGFMSLRIPRTMLWPGRWVQYTSHGRVTRGVKVMGSRSNRLVNTDAQVRQCALRTRFPCTGYLRRYAAGRRI